MAIAPLPVAVAAIGSSEPIAVTDEECGRKPVEMQNVTDLLGIFSLGMIVPNRSDRLNIESDYRPHSSSDPPDGGPPSPRGKAWRLRRIFTVKSNLKHCSNDTERFQLA